MPQEVRADLLLGRDTLSPGLVKAGQAASDASGNIRQLTRDLYEVGKQRATPIVDLQDAAAEAKLEDVAAKLKDLGARAADPNIDVQDKAAVASVASMRVKLDQLGRQVSSPRITLGGLDRAEAGILKLDLMLDQLDRKHAAPEVSSGRFSVSRLLKSPFSGNALKGLITGSEGGLSGLSDVAASPAGAAGIAAAVSMLPGLLGGATGLGVGGAGLMGVMHFDPKQFKAALAPISSTLRSVFQPIGPAMLSILKPVSEMLKQIAPALRSIFADSVPGIRQFITALTPAVKQLLPVLDQTLLQLNKSGLMKDLGQSLGMLLTGGVKALSGMASAFESSGALIRGVVRVLSDLIANLGKQIGLAVNFIADLIHGRWGKVWDDMKAIVVDQVKLVQDLLGSWSHKIADVFDGIRHDISHWWDVAWQYVVDHLKSSIDSVTKQFDDWRHSIATWFGTARHDIASWWDTIWNNTVTRVKSGIGDVVTWFGKLPGEIMHALLGLGTDLYNYGKNALQMIWNGAKSLVHPIESFFGGFAHGIVSIFKKIWGWFSPSAVMYEGGKSLMEGLAKGIKDHAHTAQNAAKGAAGSVSSMGVPASGALQDYAKKLLAAYGWGNQWAPFDYVEMREAGWDIHATNPTSGAYGLAQALPPSKYASAGADWRTSGYTQLRWMMNYIRDVYGSPAGAALHEAKYNWYGSGLQGGLFTRPTLIGVGERGPERVDVTPVSHGGSRRLAENLTVNINHVPGYSTPKDVDEAIAHVQRRFRLARA